MVSKRPMPSKVELEASKGGWYDLSLRFLMHVVCLLDESNILLHFIHIVLMI